MRGALFDASGAYRYKLTRSWPDSGRGVVCFILLNPSRADAERDDPTIRRCIGFARVWGFAALEVVNLFAYRTQSPSELRKVYDPIGPDNDGVLRDSASSADCVVAGWGMHGAYRDRSRHVRALLSETHCLGYTASGEPRHPLYLPSNAERRILWT